MYLNWTLHLILFSCTFRIDKHALKQDLFPSPSKLNYHSETKNKSEMSKPYMWMKPVPSWCIWFVAFVSAMKYIWFWSDGWCTNSWDNLNHSTFPRSMEAVVSQNSRSSLADVQSTQISCWRHPTSIVWMWIRPPATKNGINVQNGRGRYKWA